jgi:hypothetical protein
MAPGYICAAGIDLKTYNHVRPTLNGRLPAGLLRRNGGPFEIGAVIDLGTTAAAGSAPEVEDRLFSRANLKLIERMNAEDFWEILEKTSETDLTSIFGPALKPNGKTCAVNINSGIASLGCLVPSERPVISAPFGNVKIDVSDGSLSPNLPMTDVRFFEEDFETPKQEAISLASKRLRAGEEAILSVGLTRAWRKPRDTSERHWLQVNGIHLKNDPLGESFDAL